VLRKGHYEPGSPVAERRARPPLRGDYRRIHVVHGGIDADRFRPQPPEAPAIAALRRDWGVEAGQVVFGVVGGYDLPRGKGQREFLQAAAQARQQIPHARFVIVGRGNMAALLVDDIRALGLDGIASLTPYCRDMPIAMNALDCLVHPQLGTEAFPE
jgi:glycosyltransferase involved in cell wall biosynthesis